MADWDLHRGFARHLSWGQLIALDALAAAALTVTPMLVAFGPAPTLLPGTATPAWIGWLIAAGTGLPVAVRRLWPLPVFAVVLVVSVVSVFPGIVRTSFIAAAFALYAVALTQPSRRWPPTWLIGGCSVLGVLAVSLAGVPSPGGTALLRQVLFGLVIMCGSWTVGRAVRERREYALRSAEQLAGRAVTEERLRIARELHDVVAHGMSLIAVQAGVANHVMQVRPGEARSALRVIEATSRTSLAELRRMLGVLRSAEPAGTGSGCADPAPGLADLPRLSQPAEQAGIKVEMMVHGGADVPAGIGLSVYRIVQESLTNVIRHAAAATCRVSVRADGREVTIEVVDDGRGRAGPDGRAAREPAVRGARELDGRGAREPAHGTGRSAGGDRPGGHGLLGMRERVAAYGGRLAAGPRAGGGFGVSALIPYEPIRQAGSETP